MPAGLFLPWGRRCRSQRRGFWQARLVGWGPVQMNHTTDGRDLFLSAGSALPDHLLIGFAWVGADLVRGQAGYAAYRAHRKAIIPPGEDGAYVTVNRIGDKTVIGTDFCGYGKVFLYQQGDFWALSNSFERLVAELRGSGHPITPDQGVLRHFTGGTAAFQQLPSHQTAVAEITLVPSSVSLVIDASRALSVTKIPEVLAFDQAATAASYSQAMARYIAIWIARFGTIFASGLPVSIDVSGGRDSRAVLGLALLAARQLGLGFDRFAIHSSTKHRAELAIAQTIAERFGLTFRPAGGGTRDTLDSYGLWRKHALGVYAPFYIFRSGMTRLHLTGGGGESHRPYYTGSKPQGTWGRWLAALADLARGRPAQGAEPAAAVPRHDFEAGLEAGVISYRYFRDRFHFGLGAVERDIIAPLASKYLRAASSRCAPERFARAEVMADLIAFCDRDLAAIPFDEPHKRIDLSAPRPEIPLDPARIPPAGRVHGAEASEAEPEAKVLPLLAFLDDFDAALPICQQTGLLPRRYLAAAARTAAQMRRTGKRPAKGDNHCTRLSTVILAAFLAQARQAG